MICHFCNKPCNMTVRDSKGTLYNCHKPCLEESRQKKYKGKGDKELHISVIYKGKEA